MKVVKVPGKNGLGYTHGVEGAPDSILSKLKDFYVNSEGKPLSSSSLDIEAVNLSNDDLEKENSLIYKKSFSSFSLGKRVVFLGGDHSVSYSLTRGFFDYCQNEGEEPCLIVFDSHPDLMVPVDQKIPTHEEWLRALIKDGFPVSNILLVGIRNLDVEEFNFIQKYRIRQVLMDKFLENFEDTVHYIMEFSHGKKLYVSLDIDVVDPSFAPGTGYLVPGGFSSAEILYLVKKISKIKNLMGVDLVEVNPKLDTEKGITTSLAANILLELLSK